MSQKNLHEYHEESESEDDEEKRTLFCANLDEKVTEDLLYEVFLQAGPVDSARIPKDQSGRRRTFGFITYSHKSTIPYAMQLYQGLSLYRKSVTIKYQGSTQQTPRRNYDLTGCNNTRSSYDNSSLRGSNYSSYEHDTPKNPFRNSYPPEQHNISKHASTQLRLHTNANPYQRKVGDNSDYSGNRDHTKRRNHNNGSNRHSEQRFSRKSRR